MEEPRASYRRRTSSDSGPALNTCQRSLFLKIRELEEKISSFETTKRELTEERDRQKQRLQSIDRYLSRGWIYFSESVYLGSTTERNWSESRQFCQDQGADLVIITSVQEKDFISSIYKDRRWIGLSDLQEEGVWRWVDGTKLTTSFWMSGEPNDTGTGEDCVEINYKGQLGRWNDENCGVAHQFICERRLDDL
ncbi:unnamed protein product [Knipowitschia caucasica]|uniref:C-type lectin domain-containing protein n=1 Tax=Knipowitschia caucasica TaxID=637954 RepID=A0AAV2MFE7_KNICA